jgi:hypothetical protein
MKKAFILVVSLLAAGAVIAETTDQAATQTVEKTNAPAGQQTVNPVKEAWGAQFQSGVGKEFLDPSASTAGSTDASLPATSYRSVITLQPPKPNNVVPSNKFQGVEYSGIFVQVVRNNPLQLINPFAPASYGDGEVNIVRNPATKKAAGLKAFQITF